MEDLDTGTVAIIWLSIAAAFGAGEIMIAGAFFLAPFAVGALAAAIVSAFGAAIPFSLLAFLAVSIIAFLALRPLSRKLDVEVPEAKGLGANRLLESKGFVTETIPAKPGEAGLIKIGSELWRAETEENLEIGIDQEVQVTKVVGTRLTVIPVTPKD